MFQKFFTDTIMSRFIKNLLATTPMPLITPIGAGDIAFKGSVYTWNNFVIKCVSTGRMFIDETEELYPSNKIYPSIVLYPGTGEAVAKYQVLATMKVTDRKYYYTYHSKYSYYDSDTHRYLGEYLRYLKSHKGLDLLKYYNCYNYTILDGVSLHNKNDEGKTYSLVSDSRYKVLAVPIKFFKSYTIALNCHTEVLCRCVIYGDSGMLKKRDGLKSVHYSDMLEESFLKLNSTNFDNPFLYQAHAPSSELFNQQKNLYLLIQVPSSNNSSVVVLEGDYFVEKPVTTLTTTSVVRTVNPNGDDNSTDTASYEESETIIEIEKEGVGELTTPATDDYNLSLLRMDTHTTYAFSDRLIEYLLLNIIHQDDTLYQNIARIQESLSKFYDKMVATNRQKEIPKISAMATALALKKSKFGIWDAYLSDAIKELTSMCSISYNLFDMDGNVSREIEEILSREVGY